MQKTCRKIQEIIWKIYNIKKDISGYTPPSNLISLINYPKLSLGILTSYNEK